MTRFIIAATALTLTAPAAFAQSVNNPCAYFNATHDQDQQIACDLRNSDISPKGAELLSSISREDIMGGSPSAAQILDESMDVVNNAAARIFMEIEEADQGSI